jgi:OOP family OmpA-OmpF porin
MRWSPLVLLAMTSVAFAGPKYEMDGHVLKVPHPVLFEAGGPVLQSASDDAIAYVKGYLADKKVVTTLRIEVHTDSQGGDAHNQRMSEQRALAVAKALVAKGVDCGRLVAVGFGESKPIADNRTAEGRGKNRRVVFANAALRGKAINGDPLDGGGKSAGSACD